jgi:hypothetical protein
MKQVEDKLVAEEVVNKEVKKSSVLFRTVDKNQQMKRLSEDIIFE